MDCSKNIILRDEKICYYFKYLEWDSIFFERSSYLLDVNKSNLLESEIVKQTLKKMFLNSFVTIKLNTELNSKIADFLQDCGFKYIDTEVILEYKKQSNLKTIQNDIYIEKVKVNNNLPYKDLGSSFNVTRFHCDMNISDKKADDLWINYLKNYKLSDSKHMFSAKINNELSGIILINIDKEVATVFFVAVIKKYRGCGIGKLLIDKVFEYFKNYTIRTETQVKNINALNFYISNGLSKIQKTLIVLHRWS